MQDSSQLDGDQLIYSVVSAKAMLCGGGGGGAFSVFGTLSGGGGGGGGGKGWEHSPNFGN